MARGCLGLVAVLLTGLAVTLGASSGQAATLGPGRPSVPGFVGYVTRDGEELGVGRLADGTFGVCVDTGGSHAWPGGTPLASSVTNPRVGFVVSKYLSTARTNPRAAAALWWVVGKDLGLNSAPGAMQSRIDQMRLESPAIHRDVRRWHDLMLADANAHAPFAGGYRGTSIRLVRTSPISGTITGIGAQDRSDQWVRGYQVTVRLSGARFSSGRTTWTGTTGAASRSLGWGQQTPGPVKVEEVVSGLPSATYRLHDAHDGTQRVVAAGARETSGGAAVLAPDFGWARVRKVAASTGSPLAGATFRAWADVDGDGTFDSGEHHAVLVSGAAGWTSRFRSFRGVRVCFQETKAPEGYRLNPAPACSTATGAARPPAEVRVADAPSRVPLTVTKSAEGDDPAGMLGVTVETHAGSPTGPRIGTHTFTGNDVTGGRASYTFGSDYDPDKTYFVVITAEPSGWIADASVVEASLGRDGAGLPTDFTAALADQKVWQPVLSTQISSRVAEVGAVLTDSVEVTDTGGHTLTGEWRLVGTVQPVAGHCVSLDWRGAPVVASGAFTVSGDGLTTVGSYRVSGSGCFTYQERLAPTRTSTEVPWTQPGAVSETVLVRSAPHLATQVNAQRATAGAVLVDEVSVTGTDGAAVPGMWRLLGPLAPSASATCERLDWALAPVAARGRFVAQGDGTRPVGRFRTVGGGCYTYVERLAATATTLPLRWTRPGVAAETSLIRPRQPQVPAHPNVPAGGRSVAGPGMPRRTSPGLVALPAVGLRAALSTVGFVGNRLTPPPSLRAAGLWGQGAALDAVVGTTVVVGHVSDDHDRPGELQKLSRTHAGQLVTTHAADGTVQVWRIRRVWLTPKADLPRSIFLQGLSRHLVLITCGRRITTSSGGFHYTHNLIVDAVPVRYP